jgi:hypothetical protein
VLLNGAPESGVNVVFQDDTGAPISTSQTGTNGTVSQLVVAGSQVTVVLGTQQNPNLVTIQDVAPGDALTVVDTSASTSPPPFDYQVVTTLPAGSWDAAAVAERVTVGACSDPIAYPVYLQPGCQSGGVFPLLATALDDTTDLEVAYTYQTGNPLIPDGGLPDGDTTIPVVVTRPWSTSTVSATISATNLPPLPVDAGAQGGYSATLIEVSGGIATSSSAGSPGGYDAGAQSNPFVVHSGYPDFVQAETLADRDSVYSSVVAFIGGATRSATPPASQTIPFDLSTLPLFNGTSILSDDGGVPAQPTVTWTTTGSLSAAAGIYISAQWNASSVTDAGTTYTNGTWTIIAPPTATSVQAPALSSPVAAWAPPAGASWNMPRMAAVQGSFFPGYPAFRAQVATLPLLQGYEIVVPLLPANGTIYVSGIYPNEG